MVVGRTVLNRSVRLDWPKFERQTQAQLLNALDVLGTLLTAWARSMTRRRNPPTRRGGPWRPAHPDPLNWSDVTGQLAASYYHRVTARPGGGGRLEWGNTADHAIYVEARDGYAVVRGVIERDGPVVPFIRRALREVAPGWRFVLAA